MPLPGGKSLAFKQPVMPDATPIDKHLAAATSMPLRLVREWVQRWGEEDATRLCLQGIENPPTTVVVQTIPAQSTIVYTSDQTKYYYAGGTYYAPTEQEATPMEPQFLPSWAPLTSSPPARPSKIQPCLLTR